MFNYKIKVKVKRLYYLLILNSYRLYVIIDFIKYYNKNKILLAILPPYLTYMLQPLDVCLFRPLVTAYSSKLSTLIDKY